MKRISDKQQARLDLTDEVRHAAIRLGVVCDGGCGQYATDCHEIPAGAYRHNALAEPRTHLWLCRECHEIAQGAPYAAQVALLTVRAIEAVNRCHGSTAVTVDDVVRRLGGVVLVD